jgi:hypothetical protein
MYTVCPIWTEFGTADAHKIVLSDFESGENWRNEGHRPTLLIGVNEFL